MGARAAAVLWDANPTIRDRSRRLRALESGLLFLLGAEGALLGGGLMVDDAAEGEALAPYIQGLLAHFTQERVLLLE